MEFRLATLDDAQRILEIYSPYITDEPVSFEIEPPSLDVFRERMRGIMEDYPYIAALEGDTVVGYGYAGRHAERRAYDWSANLSVYLDGTQKAHGIGGRLYNGLMEILKLQNVQTVLGLVVDANSASIRFHEKHGFRRVGTYENMGYKLGQWRDVAVFQKHISNHPNPPQPFIPISKLDGRLINDIFAGL